MDNQQKRRDIIHDAPHTIDALECLRGVPFASQKSIINNAKELLQRSVDPNSGPPEVPSDGLLYGLIQSGKTSIIQITTAMAVDNGFQCILMLTSDMDLLYNQTLERMRHAIHGIEVLGKNDWEDKQRFERALKNFPFVIVCSKNGKKLSSLLNAFKIAGIKAFSTLIIDDEADQASLNTHESKNNDQVSRINEVISDLRNFFQVNTYLQVTATPQALFLQSSDHRYRPSFTVISHPGEGYVGGADFFGEGSEDLLRLVPIEEIDQLKSTHQPAATGEIPSGLRNALLTFLVSATVKKLRDDKSLSAFLCHVSVKTKDHVHIVNLIERFKEELIKTMKDEKSNKYESLMKEFKNSYEDLQRTETLLQDFPKIIEKIRYYIKGADIKLINASTKEPIKLDRVFNIFIGGNKLGRGVTIENLLVTYYGRNPRNPNADTVLQHARMYGYRKKDLGLTRLFLPELLADHFTLIHEMEKALRMNVERYPNQKLEVVYIGTPIRPTRSNVLPDSVVGYVAGASINPRYPLRTQEAAKHTEWIDEKLKDIGNSEKEGRKITIDDIIEFIDHCPHDQDVGGLLWNPKIITAALEQLKSLLGKEAYLVVKRDRQLKEKRGETKGIISGAEGNLAPSNFPTLFLYRQNPSKPGEIPVWWPQLRFPEGGRNYVLSFSVAKNEIEEAEE